MLRNSDENILQAVSSALEQEGEEDICNLAMSLHGLSLSEVNNALLPKEVP